MIFDRTFTEGWIRRFGDSVLATEPELTELDQQAGDGDFGANLGAGLTLAVRALDRDRSAGEGAGAARVPLDITATVFLDEVGGTSGPLFGLLFQELAVSAEDTAPVLTTPGLAAGTEAGLAAVRRVGEAAPGDKTLIDALAPAAEALRRCPADLTPDQALVTAAEGAWGGVRETAHLRARRGRASYLGDRVSGVADPGAVGIALLFASADGTVTELAPLLAERAEEERRP
ncbi:dihydroxyacetone kinase subunit DhaL [Streptomyces sp. TP-A0874]|uniref:dihydroxyacetone kinase subunit DhaL n=1 Tax=Streptomyces sp. TP-A0874 TaxID=549819 RepID=UPI0008531154|nr:dihydroxyacetone kinase subunit DhaL [Streptomyces sp. TP-A0874]